MHDGIYPQPPKTFQSILGKNMNPQYSPVRSWGVSHFAGLIWNGVDLMKSRNEYVEKFGAERNLTFNFINIDGY